MENENIQMPNPSLEYYKSTNDLNVLYSFKKQFESQPKEQQTSNALEIYEVVIERIKQEENKKNQGNSLPNNNVDIDALYTAMYRSDYVEEEQQKKEQVNDDVKKLGLTNNHYRGFASYIYIIVSIIVSISVIIYLFLVNK